MAMKDREQFFENLEDSELVVIQVNASYGGVRCYIEKTISYEESLPVLRRIQQLTADSGGYFIFKIIDAKTFDPMFSLHSVYKKNKFIAT